MPRSLRSFLVVALLVTLAVPAAAGAEPWKVTGWFDFLLAKWTSIWAENGCGLDPSGRCGTAPVVIWAENGCSIDPNGRCGTAPVVNGCSLDSSGLCANRR